MFYKVITSCNYGVGEEHLVEVKDSCELAIEDIADELLIYDIAPEASFEEIPEEVVEELIGMNWKVEVYE